MNVQYADYDRSTSSVVTCVTLPSSLTFEHLAREFRAEGIVVYEGKGVLQGTTFQIGHIGALRKHDTRNGLRQLRKILRKVLSEARESPAAEQEAPLPASR